MTKRKPFIPETLKAMPNWMLWKLIHKQGQDKPAKVPFNPATGQACNPVDAANYTAFPEALAVWKGSPKAFQGLAFGLVQGVVCVDLDNSLNEHGQPLPWAADILDRLPASFMEVSQSGKGLHWFGLASLPPQAKQRFTLPCGNRVEIYDRNRFIAMTGKATDDSPKDVVEAQEAITALYAWLKNEEPSPTLAVPTLKKPKVSSRVSENDLLQRMFESKHGHEIQALWRGDTSQHNGDESAADLALLSHLAFWTNKDALEMERLFSQSGLGQRDKWQKRADYRQRSIQKALASVVEGYAPRPEKEGETVVNREALALAPWPEMKPIVRTLPEVPEFNPELIPAQARPWLLDAAHRKEAPIEYFAACLMVTLSSLIGRQLAMRPKQKDSWEVIPNLWGMMVGRPSTMKTPSANDVMFPLREMEALAHERFIQEKADYETALKVYDAMVSQVEKNIKTQVAKAQEEGANLNTLQQQGLDELKAIEAPQKPTCKRYMVNACTVEKLRVLLSENPNGLLVFHDELSGFLRKLDKDGHEADRSFYLQAWNGNQDLSDNTISRSTTRVANGCVSIFGGIQPGVISKWVHDTMSLNSRDDGFLQRFQVVVWPDVHPCETLVDEYENAQAKRAYRLLFESLACIDTVALGAIHPEHGLPYFHFTEDAQSIFNAWLVDWVQRTREQYHDAPALEAHFYKFTGLAPSLALICHVASGGKGAVDVTALVQALDWVELLQAHALRFYTVGLNQHLELAKRLQEHIKKGALGVLFTRRELKRKHWQGTNDEKTLDLALDTLEEHGIIRLLPDTKPTGRPSECYQVNPALYSPTTDDE